MAGGPFTGGPAADGLPGCLLVETSHGTWVAQAAINATGTWSSPDRPWYPGLETFAGRQLHVAQYVSAAEFADQHVVVVGGGISAVQLLPHPDTASSPYRPHPGRHPNERR